MCQRQFVHLCLCARTYCLYTKQKLFTKYERRSALNMMSHTPENNNTVSQRGDGAVAASETNKPARRSADC